MEEKDIVSLYFLRDERAIEQSDSCYGRYLYTVAYTILQNAEDAKECVNDGYFRAWNAIPPEKPRFLKAYLARIVRNLALNRQRGRTAEKRQGQVDGAFEELSGILSEKELTMDEQLALKDVVNRFLSGLPKNRRILFMQRYWYFLSVKDIAEKNGMGESAVKVSLMRTRNAFKKHLEKEGFIL